jgi:hypothetical protein
MHLGGTSGEQFFTEEVDVMPTRKVLTNTLSFLAFLTAVGIGGAAWPPAWGQEDPTLARYDVAIRPIELLAPGTVIEKTAPAPYTHLIVKSFPRLGAGDLQAVNNTTKQLASFLHTSLMAKVGAYQVKGESRYRLEEVATGFGTNIPGRGDTIISPDTERKLGANLGFLARIVLAKCYEEQQKCRYMARSNTMALVDTPVILVRNGQHRKSVLRYAFLVSERSGRLDTLIWMIDLDNQGQYAEASGDIHWLAPNTLVDCVMAVDADLFTLGVPSDIAFACVKTPQGERSLPLSSTFAPLAGLPQFTAEQAKSIEIQLWNILQQLASQR